MDHLRKDGGGSCEVFRALSSAGQDDAVKEPVSQLLQGRVAENRDAVRAGSPILLKRRDGHLRTRPPQQVDRGDRLDLFKALSQKNQYRFHLFLL